MLGIFLDLETNGLNPFKHRVLEIALKIIDLYTGKLVGQYDSIVQHPLSTWQASDLISLEVNGFTLEKMNSGKTEDVISKEVTTLFNNCSIKRGGSLYICQNPSFDRIFFDQLISVENQEKFQWPYHWLDLASMYWALHIKEMPIQQTAPLKDGLSKDEIAKSCNIPPETRPHTAMNGVNHLYSCYKSVVGIPRL
ncbi:MAG: hypothetical protein P4L16_01280 [Chlamydiales bacterium]|nr:hypothetical protein [Chlamydiales bacterium]